METKKTIRLMLLVAIFGTIVYLFVTSSSLLKMGSDDACGWEQITSVSNRGINNYTYVLDGTQKVGVILPDWNEGLYNEYQLKVKAFSEGIHEVTTYNFDNSTIRTFFVLNGTNDVTVNNVDFRSGSYVMFDCTTCTTNNNVIIQQETLGEPQEVIYYNHSLNNYEVTENLYVSLYGQHTCYKTIKQFFWLWVGLLFFCLLIIGLVKGYEQTGDALLKWD